MSAGSIRLVLLLFFSIASQGALLSPVLGQSSAQSSSVSTNSASKSSSATPKKTSSATDAPIDAGAVVNGVYRNKTFGLTCTIPAGWVMRTEEMNARDDASQPDSDPVAKDATRVGQPGVGRVLLAAFSRPPEAKGEDVNASILIAAESAATYPGLKEAAQYFGPLLEVTKAQGLTMDEDPYDVAVGTTTLVRGDFHKDVGSRVMRQSTLVMLSHGYALSITLIGGTDDEVEDLVDGLSFVGRK
jgi:hypothetical protein